MDDGWMCIFLGTVDAVHVEGIGFGVKAMRSYMAISAP